MSGLDCHLALMRHRSGFGEHAVHQWAPAAAGSHAGLAAVAAREPQSLAQCVCPHALRPCCHWCVHKPSPTQSAVQQKHNQRKKLTACFQ